MPGTPGRKYARTLDSERVKLATRNAGIKAFREKFVNPKSLRRAPSISPTIWGQQLQAWRFSKKWVAKEAAGKLSIPFDTYRGWESGKHTPQLIVQQEIEKRMREYDNREHTEKVLAESK